jgi:hypothetical protein
MTLKSRIRQVKREIRALGIVAKGLRGGGGLAVGVIFRGGLYLDGVIKAKAHGPDITGAVAEMIKASPHYPQIRVLLINEAPHRQRGEDRSLQTTYRCHEAADPPLRKGPRRMGSPVGCFKGGARG